MFETLFHGNLTSVRIGVLNVPGAIEGSNGASTGTVSFLPRHQPVTTKAWRCQQRHAAYRPRFETARYTFQSGLALSSLDVHILTAN